MYDQHTQRDPLPCPHCGDTYKSEGGLQYHISQYHSKLYSFECHICDFKTTQKQLLRRHLNRHNPDKTFICQECGRACYSLHSFKQHTFTHTNERPWKCDLCEKVYKRKEKLRVHKMRFHENRADYECPVCAEEFYRSETLRQHLRKVHPEYEMPPKGAVLHRKSKEKKFVAKVWKKVEKVGGIVNDPVNESWSLKKFDTIVNKGKLEENKIK